MKIGILMTGHAIPELVSAQGDYDAMFERLLAGRGFDFESWDVVGGALPDAADSAEGWIVTGSRHGAYEDLPWIAPLEAFIRDVHAAGVPLIGICFGHQIVAQALGGRVAKFPGGWSIGRQTYEIAGKSMALNAWHQDQVIGLPEGARVIGSSAFCANAALAYGDSILTIQAHPEFDSEVVDALVRHRGRGTVPDDLLDAAMRDLDAPAQRAECAELMAAFLHDGARHA